MKKIKSFSYIFSIVIFGMATTAICTALQTSSARPVSQNWTEQKTN